MTQNSVVFCAIIDALISLLTLLTALLFSKWLRSIRQFTFATIQSVASQVRTRFT